MLGVNRFDALHLIERHQDIVGLHQRCERMPGANDAQMPPFASIGCHQPGQFLDAGGWTISRGRDCTEPDQFCQLLLCSFAISALRSS